MDIRCRKTSCIFNKDYTCKSKSILIKKDGICLNYKKGDKPCIEKTKWIYTNTPPKYAKQREVLKMQIDCKKDCLFNEKGCCVANGITINDIKEKPICITFLKK